MKKYEHKQRHERERERERKYGRLLPTVVIDL